jgi:hypothetical protein
MGKSIRRTALVCQGKDALSPRDVTVVAVIPNHLFASVENVGTQGGQPLQGFKGFQVLPAFKRVYDLGFKREVGHSFLGERGPEAVPMDEWANTKRNWPFSYQQSPPKYWGSGIGLKYCVHCYVT